MGNRVIKFRGKRIDNGEWVYGYYVRHETRQLCPIDNDKLKPEEIKHLIVVDSFADWNMPRKLQGIEVIPETVGQYAGLKDKNGKEIYEGDIVHLPQHNHSGRVFLNVNHGWVVEGICMSVKVHNYKNIEVIGNIHDWSEE